MSPGHPKQSNSFILVCSVPFQSSTKFIDPCLVLVSMSTDRQRGWTGWGAAWEEKATRRDIQQTLQRPSVCVHRRILRRLLCNKMNFHELSLSLPCRALAVESVRGCHVHLIISSYHHPSAALYLQHLRLVSGPLFMFNFATTTPDNIWLGINIAEPYSTRMYPTILQILWVMWGWWR